MAKPCCHIFIHFVWATWDRQPLIPTAIEPNLWECIENQCRECGCQSIAIGGTADHIHQLTRLSSKISVAQLIKAMKGSSSHLVNHELERNMGFRWQGSYGAFSVSRRDLRRVRNYVEAQKVRHAQGRLWQEAERCEEFDDLDDWAG